MQSEIISISGRSSNDSQCRIYSRNSRDTHTHTHTYTRKICAIHSRGSSHYALVQRRFTKSFHVTHTCWTLLGNYFRGSRTSIKNIVPNISRNSRNFARLRNFITTASYANTRSCIYILQHTKSYPLQYLMYPQEDTRSKT